MPPWPLASSRWLVVGMLPMLVALGGCADDGNPPPAPTDDAEPAGSVEPVRSSNTSRVREVKDVDWEGHIAARVCATTCVPPATPLTSSDNRFLVEGADFANGTANLTLTWQTQDPLMQQLVFRIWPYVDTPGGCCGSSGPIVEVAGSSPLHLDGQGQPEEASLGLAITVLGPMETGPVDVRAWTSVSFTVEGTVVAGAGEGLGNATSQ